MLGCYADVGVDSFVTPRTREATSAMGMRFVTVRSGPIDCRIVFDPSHAPDRTITVTRCGRICMGALKINLSQAFAGQKVGVKQVEEKIWLVSFMRYDLGFFDHETCRIEAQ